MQMGSERALGGVELYGKGLCVFVCLCECVCVGACVYICVCMYVCMHVCTYARVCVFACVHACAINCTSTIYVFNISH